MIYQPSLYPVANIPSQVVMANGAIGLLKQVNQKHPLFLVTPSIQQNPNFEKLAGFFKNKCVQAIKHGKLSELNSLFSDHSPCEHDIVISLGGGRVLDFSKLVRHSLTYNHLDAFSETSKGKPSIPLVAIPTYPGSGSETNGTAAIWNEGTKQFFVNQTFIPDLIIYDLKFLDTLNERLVALAVADMFTHATESFFSKKSNTMMKSFAQMALDNLKEFDLVQWNSKKNKETLFTTGYLAGISVGNTFAGACHALAHAYEQLTGKSHGQAVLNFTKANMRFHLQHSQNPDWQHFLTIYDGLQIERFREPKEVILEKKKELIELALKEEVLKTDSIRIKEEHLEVLLSLL